MDSRLIIILRLLLLVGGRYCLVAGRVFAEVNTVRVWVGRKMDGEQVTNLAEDTILHCPVNSQFNFDKLNKKGDRKVNVSVDYYSF